MPDYITSNLTEYKPLRPSEDKQLVVRKTHLNYGDILFHVAAAKMWNAAPLPLKTVKTIGSFKSQLKDVFIQVEFIVEDVLYGFMFHLRAFVFYINSVLNWITC